MSESLAELFGNSVPSYIIKLPSLGLMNDAEDFDEDFDPNAVVVRPVGLWQEIHFKDPTTILSGKATTELLKIIAPEIKKPQNILTIDIEAMTLASRIASHGPKMTTMFSCTNPDKGPEGKPVCVHETEFIVSLDQLLMNFPTLSAEDLINWRVVLVGKGITFTVYLKLPTYKMSTDMMKLFSRYEQLLTFIKDDKFDAMEEDQKQSIVDQITNVVAELNFVRLFASIAKIETDTGLVFSDAKEITAALNSKSFPKMWLDKITNKIDKLVKPYNQAGRVDVTCSNCGHVTKDVSVLQSADALFTPPSQE